MTSLQSKAPSSSRKPRILRFGLASLLLLMIPLGLGFAWLRHYWINRPIEWRPYSAAELDHHLGEGRTVLVCFYGRWDLTSAWLGPSRVDTPQVTRWMRTHGVIAMEADYTNHSPEIEAALTSLGQKQVPVVAVYPASTPDEPIVLVGAVTEKAVLAALEQAERRRQ